MNGQAAGGELMGILVADAPMTANELQAMLHERVIWQVLPGAYASIAHPDGPEVRAKAAAALAAGRLRAGSAIGRLSAAWIHGCAPPPAELEILVPRFHRLAAASEPLRIALSETRLPAEDVVQVGGSPVTSPVRTALDIAFHCPEPTARMVLTRMVNHPSLHCPRGRLLELIEAAERRPGKLHARELVSRLMVSA